MTGTASGDHWDITVPDVNFDDHVLSQYGWIYISDRQYDGAWKSDPEEWAWIGYDYYYNDPPGDLNALSGNNICYCEGGYIYQILDGTFIEGVTYTLSAGREKRGPATPSVGGFTLPEKIIQTT